MGSTTCTPGRLIDTTELTRISRWARAKMREGSPRTSSRCTRTASSSWTSTRMAPLTKMTSVVLLTTWSRCSRRRWLETETTPMTSLSRLSRLMTMKEKAPPPVEEAAPAEEDEGEAKKKKKKKKKAA